MESYLLKWCKLFVSVLLFPAFFLKLSAQNSEAEILWDNYGVPHIYAKDFGEMYYAFGWAQMSSHANLLLKIYGQARGRAAEYWGKDWLASDKQVLLYDLPAKAEKFYSSKSTEYKNYLNAFVKGINDYAAKHPEAIDKEIKQVLPATGTDVIANLLRTCYRFLTATERAATEKLFQPASNAYAIAPSRSASGNAMLVINPHLPWENDFTTLFEVNLNTTTLHLYGATLVGEPVLSFAFNDHLGWTHTVNTLDAADRYELTLQGDGYLLDSTTVLFDKKIITIKIKQPEGTMQEEKTEFKYSKHGPIAGEKGNKAYAVRVAGLDNAELFEQYHKMAMSTTWNEFESALRMMQLPMFNVIYADKAGNIFYLFDGNLPKKPSGDFPFWRGTIDGTQSKLIWHESFSYSELPKLFNPATGFLQNANDPPWSCTYPPLLDPRKFPAYVSPLAVGLRPQHALNMIKDDSSISFDELVNYKMNTGMEGADRFLDDLLTAVEKYPDSTALAAVAVLKSWDKKTDANSKGAVLFTTWFNKIDPSMYATRWRADAPLTTPDGLKDGQQAVSILVKAAEEVKKKYGSLNVAWGDAYRFRVNNIDLPASGGFPQTGVFMSVNYTEDKDNKNRAEGGETFIGVIEFGKKVKAQVLLGYGNASQPNNKHAGDQLKLLSEKKLRPALLTKTEVLKNLEKKEVLRIDIKK